MKELEKKIETLKPNKKSQKEISSQRNLSKTIVPQSGNNMENKSLLSNFMKKNNGTLTKILKKSQSDKYLIKDMRVKKKKESSEINLSKENEKDKSIDLINNFVTQVTRTEAI